jgi:hypothetical protein
VGMRKLWTAVLGAYVGLQGTSLIRADEPVVPRKIDLPTRSSQQIADAVAETLRTNPRLRYWRVQVEVVEGVAQITGVVANPSQHDEVVRTVQTVPGVVSVVDRIRVMGGVVPVQGTLLAQGPELKKVPLLEGLPGSGEPPIGKTPLTPPGIGEMPPGGPIGPPPTGAPYGGIQEPTPIFQAPAGMPNPAILPPPMPPYAWPAYAPYNNYSRVAYPTLYPYEQFPFIGPFYPYPKVPTGWRAVTLRWQDGYWWYGKDVTGHDWWRIRHW